MVDTDCVQAIGTPLCDHIAHYYLDIGIVGDPIYYWKVPTDQLPIKTRIVVKPSTTGDPCHRELRGLTTKQSKDFFRKQRHRFENFHVCQDGIPVNLKPT